MDVKRFTGEQIHENDYVRAYYKGIFKGEGRVFAQGDRQIYLADLGPIAKDDRAWSFSFADPFVDE